MTIRRAMFNIVNMSHSAYSLRQIWNKLEHSQAEEKIEELLNKLDNKLDNKFKEEFNEKFNGWLKKKKDDISDDGEIYLEWCVLILIVCFIFN